MGGVKLKYVTISGTSGGGGCPGCPAPQIVISPNPTDGEVSVTFSDAEEMELYLEEMDQPIQVRVSSLLGNSIYQGVMNKNGLKINLKHADRGIYIVEVWNKDFQEQHQLILE